MAAQKATTTADDALQRCLNEIDVKVTRALNLAEAADRALRGHNGTPGLVAQVSGDIEDRKDLAEMVKQLSSAILGDTKTPGLLEQVRIIQAFIDRQKHWELLAKGTIATAVIVTIVNLGIQLLLK